jgi:hypothetical protein
MPGSPGHGPKARLEQRSRRELWAWIVIFPVVGSGILLWGVLDAVANAHEWGFGDWLFRVGWVGLVGLVLLLGLPGTAWRELRRRKLEEQQEPRPNGEAESVTEQALDREADS